MLHIVLTPGQDAANERQRANVLLQQGVHRLHIRKHGYSEPQYREYIEAIAEEYRERLVIHHFYHLLKEYGLAGIHLSSHARMDNAIRAEVSDIDTFLISASFHSWKEIEADDTPYGYVFISPVFNSISKPGYDAAIHLAQATPTRALRIAKNSYCPAIIGLGGVTMENTAILERNGFDGGAMLGSIWQ